jgi:hypothetical protein
MLSLTVKGKAKVKARAKELSTVMETVLLATV